MSTTPDSETKRIADLLINNVNGLLVEKPNIDALADQIIDNINSTVVPIVVQPNTQIKPTINPTIKPTTKEIGFKNEKYDNVRKQNNRDKSNLKIKSKGTKSKDIKSILLDLEETIELVLNYKVKDEVLDKTSDFVINFSESNVYPNNIDPHGNPSLIETVQSAPPIVVDL